MGLISDVLNTVKGQVRAVVPPKTPPPAQEPTSKPKSNVLPRKRVGLVSSVLKPTSTISPERQKMREDIAVDIARRDAEAKKENSKLGMAKNFVKATPKSFVKVFDKVGEFAKEVVQALPRAAVSTAISADQSLNAAGIRKENALGTYDQASNSVTPKGKVANVIFGERPIYSIKEKGRSAVVAVDKALNSKNATPFAKSLSQKLEQPSIKEKLAVPFGFALTAFDLFPGSSAEKKAVTVIARSTDKELIERGIIQLGVPAEKAGALAAEMAATKDKGLITRLLNENIVRKAAGTTDGPVTKALTKGEPKQGTLLPTVEKSVENVGIVSRKLTQKEPKPASTYTVGGKTFNTIKEAVKHQNELQNQNKRFPFEPAKRKDATIRENKAEDFVNENHARETLQRQLGDEYRVVEPVGDLWVSKGNVIFIERKRANPGFINLLRNKNFIESVEEAGNNVARVTIKSDPAIPKSTSSGERAARSQELRAQEDTAKIQKATKKLEDQATPSPNASPKRVLPLKQTLPAPAKAETVPPIAERGGVPEQPKDISASDSYTDTVQQTDELSKEYADMLKSEDSAVAIRAKEIIETGKNKADMKNELDQLKFETSFSKEALDADPAKELSKYANKRTGELPEVLGNTKGGAISGKTKKVTSEFGKKGDQIAMDLGFENSEEAREAFQIYQQRRKAFNEQKSYIQSRVKDFREKKQIIEAVEADIRKEGRERSKMVAAIQDFFRLTDKEMHDLSRGAPDFRTMTEQNFQGYLKGMENKAYESMRHSEAVMEVNATIFEKELSKVDNLRQAMKLPELENMTLKQLEDFNALLDTYQKGDEFLGVRQLQTIRFTDIAEIKTRREALEDLAKRAGVPLSDLQAVKVVEWDKYYYDAKLARQNPFYGVLVRDFDLATVNSNLRYHEIKTKTDELMRKARASRPRRLVDKLVPTDQVIFKYLEASAEEKLHVVKNMTSDEINAALYIQDEFAKARDYLIKNEQLSRYRENYVTHVRRPFVEAWLKNDYQSQLKAMGKDVPEKNKVKILTGFRDAISEMFDVYKQDEAVFNIMNQKTGEVLPLEKFFQYSLKRSDKLVPSQNVAHAFLTYMQTFQKKVGLDSIIPKLDIYTHALTPSRMTPRGLEFDSSLKTFVKTWLNSKKGRVADTIVVKPGGKLDWMMRSGVAFTRILDLGLNIPIGLASNIGEQSFSYVNLGSKKYLSGLVRRRTAQGKAIIKKYESYTGEAFLTRMSDSSKNIGDKMTEGLFGLFSAADRNANSVHLLGNLTPQEFKSGIVSAERLSEMRLSQGRYRMVSGDTSVIGKTALGQVWKQYKSWAIPAMHTTHDNVQLMIKMLKKGENPMHTREFHELKREVILASFMLFVGYGAYSELSDKKDKTFLETLAYKAMQDGLSVIGALDPSMWTATPRVIQWFADLSKSLKQVSVSLVTGERTAEGNIEGLNKLESTVIPKAVQQVTPPENIDPLHQILKERGDEKEELQNEAEETWASLKKLAETDKEKAAADFDALIQNSPELAKKVLAVYEEERLGLTEDDRLIKRLGVENGDRARYIYGEAMKLETKEARAAYLDDLITKKVVTKKVVEQIGEMVKAKEPTFEDGGVVTKTGLIHTISTYAKAIGVDPVTAFKSIFSGRKIRYIANDAIIIERMSLSESEKIKRERGNANTTGYRLDHTIPLELGGDNGDNNLQLVPEDVWKSYTPVENYLGRELRAKRITRKEAQSLITRFKAGELKASDIIK